MEESKQSELKEKEEVKLKVEPKVETKEVKKVEPKVETKKPEVKTEQVKESGKVLKEAPSLLSEACSALGLKVDDIADHKVVDNLDGSKTVRMVTKMGGRKYRWVKK